MHKRWKEGMRGAPNDYFLYFVQRWWSNSIYVLFKVFITFILQKTGGIILLTTQKAGLPAWGGGREGIPINLPQHWGQEHSARVWDVSLEILVGDCFSWLQYSGQPHFFENGRQHHFLGNGRRPNFFFEKLRRLFIFILAIPSWIGQMQQKGRTNQPLLRYSTFQ